MMTSLLRTSHIDTIIRDVVTEWRSRRQSGTDLCLPWIHWLEAFAQVSGNRHCLGETQCSASTRLTYMQTVEITCTIYTWLYKFAVVELWQ